MSIARISCAYTRCACIPTTPVWTVSFRIVNEFYFEKENETKLYIVRCARREIAANDKLFQPEFGLKFVLLVCNYKTDYNCSCL